MVTSAMEAYSTAPSSAAAAGASAREQPGGGRGGQRERRRRRRARTRSAGDDTPAGVRVRRPLDPAQLRHRGAGDDLAAPRAHRLGDRERQPADAALDAGEDRPRLLGSGRACAWISRTASVSESCGAGGLEELGDGGAHRDAVGVARVDPAEEGLDQPVDDLAAEAGGDVLADGHVVADLRAGQVGVVLDAGAGPRRRALRRGRAAVAGDAHDVALGHGAQRAAGPERGASRWRAAGGGRRGPPRGPGRPPRGGGRASTRRRGRPARPAISPGSSLPPSRSDASRTVTRTPRGQQPVGGGETGDTAPDDDDVPRTRTCVPALHASTCLRPFRPSESRRAPARVHESPVERCPCASPDRDRIGTGSGQRPAAVRRRRNVSRSPPPGGTACTCAHDGPSARPVRLLAGLLPRRGPRAHRLQRRADDSSAAATPAAEAAGDGRGATQAGAGPADGDASGGADRPPRRPKLTAPTSSAPRR